MDKEKNLCILGSTGSIGTQTLDIIRLHKGYRITSLAAHHNIQLLEKQMREFLPKKVCVYDELAALQLKDNTKDLDIQVLTGMDGLIECAADSANDLTVTALVGMIGIRPTIEAIKAGNDIALANKETLVTAGHIIIPLVKEMGIRLLPIDSEHSAIFQSLQGYGGPDGYYNRKKNNTIEKILLTASGGPFRNKSYEELKQMKAEDALKHPNWSMGKKITIDSASMVNKALEVIEAKWLFDVEPDNIEVVIQPQSIIHSAVQFVDGSIIAQLGVPDMKLPIQYALYYPERMPLDNGRVDLFELAKIVLERPDYKVFRGLQLGLDAAKLGGSMPVVFNAANEGAVALFLENKIGFTQIYDIIEGAMNSHSIIVNPTLEEILISEQATYDYIRGIV